MTPRPGAADGAQPAEAARQAPADRADRAERADPDRDRDRAGRPRNARPRDGLGRPLARGAPGQSGLPDELALAPAEGLALAQQLIDAGQPFHAHEALEAVWKSAPSAERELWRGLAQIAVGLTHAGRGNARGAVALLRRGALALRDYSQPAVGGVAVPQAREAALALADRIETDGLGSLEPADLRIQLAAS